MSLSSAFRSLWSCEIVSKELTAEGCDPNRPPRLTIRDICSTLMVLTIFAPLSVLKSLCRRHKCAKDIKGLVGHELLMCLGRRLPISLIQQNIYPRSGSLLKKSQRYAQVPFQVAQQVRKSDFAGYWVYRDISVEACPQDADLVLFHLHGGGYVMGHPLDNATELLLIAEILTRRNYTVAIFSLEYTPAPRAPLPTQHNQALAAYAWLTTELHIDPSQLYLMGESAGGHLILSLLLELHRRTHLGTMKQQQQQQQQQPPLRKPAAAIMVSPWVNLKPCGPDARANSEEIDARSAAFKQVLERFSQLVLQGSPPETERLHGNFAVRVSERGSWKDILPTQTWVSAGTAEPLFRFDTEGFVEAARADGAQLSFELAEGREHVWQTLEARKQEKQFLAMAFGEDDPTLMAGYRHIAEIIVSWLRESGNQRTKCHPCNPTG